MTLEEIIKSIIDSLNNITIQRNDIYTKLNDLLNQYNQAITDEENAINEQQLIKDQIAALQNALDSCDYYEEQYKIKLNNAQQLLVDSTI